MSKPTPTSSSRPALPTPQIPSSPQKRTRKRNELQQLIKTDWPSDSALALVRSPAYRGYGEYTNWAGDFEAASEKLTQLREMQLERDGNVAIMEEHLLTSMAAAVYGSNGIDDAGLREDITMDLCRSIFRGERLDEPDEQAAQLEYQTRMFALAARYPGLDHQLPGEVLRGYREVVSHARAFQNLLHAMVVKREPLSELLIRRTHIILCKRSSNVRRTGPRRVVVHQDGTPPVRDPSRFAGRYRPTPAQIGETTFTPPEMIPRAMASLVHAFNEDMQTINTNQQIDPFALAAKFCLEFTLIRPFLDLNGALSRIILNALLCRFVGIVVPFGETPRDRREYLHVEARASHHLEGHGEFATFVLNRAADRLHHTKRQLAGKERVVEEDEEE